MRDAASPRWRVLGLLFAVRTAMAFQFQSVAALAPAITRDLGLDNADIGLLIGIYLAPGLAFALPGGAVGRRYGDKAIVLLGLALMVAGGVLMALTSTWGCQVLGRLLAGTGGVLLNVLMSKMVTDWFAGHEIATAMGVFVNSWPFGIALALVVLPIVGGDQGTVSTGLLVATVPAFVGLIAFPILYTAPPQATYRQESRVAPAGAVLLAVVLAGVIWGLYNAALSMVFSFGPMLFVEQGRSATAAGQAVSVVLWLTVVSVPFGGYLADRTRRPRAVLIFGLLAFATMLVLVPRVDNALPALIALGLLSGLSAGPIMGLPASVLSPSRRAVGMGVFYLLFYAIIMLAPWIAGLMARSWGGARIAFDLGALFLLACCPVLMVFSTIAAKRQQEQGASNG